MSILGIAWDERGVRLSCRPDPACPPRRLDELCAVEVPQSIEVEPTVRPEGVLAAPALFDLCVRPPSAPGSSPPGWLPELMGTYLRTLVQVVESHSDAEVLLLGGVEHLAILGPFGAPASALESLRLAASHGGLPVTVIAYPVALFAAAAGSFEALRPFLVCEWDDDLVCRRMVAHESLCHLSDLIPMQRRREVGPSSLQRLLVGRLLGDHAGENVAGTLGALAARVAAWCVGEALDGRTAQLDETQPKPTGDSPSGRMTVSLPPARFAAPATKDTPDQPVRVPELRLTAGQIDAVWEPIFARAENFLVAIAREASRGGVRIAVPAGRMFQVPRLRERMLGALKQAGLETGGTGAPDDAALLGLHYCVRPRPLLPYDCGFILKRQDAQVGVGTLVLTRPAAMGEERQSEIFELPLPPQATLEIEIYVRRLVEERGVTEVRCEVVQHHAFAPALKDQRARLRVSMRVDAGDSGQATITVDIQDLNSDGHIRFERLPIAGGTPLGTMPWREPRQLAALEWVPRIRRAREPAPDRPEPRTVADWRRALEDLGAIARAVYAGQILDAVRECFRSLVAAYGGTFDDLASGLRTALANDESVEQMAPDEFQHAASSLIFGTMRTVASVASEHGAVHCGRWLRSNPADRPPDPGAAKLLVNCVSQDWAGRDGEERMTRAAVQLQTFFHWATCSPHTLNVEW